MRRRTIYALALCCLGLALRGDAGAADPVAYTVTFKPSGDPELDALLQQTASLVSLQKKLPAAPFALIGRAQADRSQFLTVLHSLGYDAGSVAITIDGDAIGDPTLVDTLQQAPSKPPVQVVVTPEKGRLFHLGTLNFATLPPGFPPPPRHPYRPAGPRRAHPRRHPRFALRTAQCRLRLRHRQLTARRREP